MKFEGYVDYLLLKYPLKDYKRVNLQLNEEVPIVYIRLTEIPLTHKPKHFPPLFFLKKGEEFDFSKLKNSPFLYWYAPEIQLAEEKKMSVLNKLFPKKLDENDEPEVQKLELNSFFKNKRKSLLKKYSLLQKNINPQTSVEWYSSSEMNFPFKFKVESIHKLWTLFHLIIFKDDEKTEQEKDRTNFTFRDYDYKDRYASRSNFKFSEIIEKCIRYYSRTIDEDAGPRKYCSNFANYGCNYHMLERFSALKFGEASFEPVALFAK